MASLQDTRLAPHGAGPLIRIIGDRFAWQVKAAILHTLGLLIGKAGPGLKPFVPQLQTTFLKCLSDQVSRNLNSREDSKHACRDCLYQPAIAIDHENRHDIDNALCRRGKCARALLATWESSQR